MLPIKQNVLVIFTNHARQRMAERDFSETAVQLIANYGEKEILANGDVRYTLTDTVPEELKDDLLYWYNRKRKIILTRDNVLKTVIANEEISCNFEIYRNYVVL
jgi:hypothetical protein